MTPHICFVNESSVINDAEVLSAVNALQVQISRDLKATWGFTANLSLAERAMIPKNAWVISILDNSDQAGALGYHDVTAAGLPLAKVFAKDDIADGLSWTVTTSHELIEMLGDPWIDETKFNQTGTAAGTIYARELCDAPEADQYGYEINGVKVSDFILQSWFEPEIKNVNRDFKGHISNAFELLPGGYIGIFPIPNNGSGWTQKVHEDQGKPGMRKIGYPKHSRRWMRMMKNAGRLQQSTAV